MKPQNFSLKFQNSLADCRIIPGSQNLVARAQAKAGIPNGARAVRKPTRAELKRTLGGRVEKNNERRGREGVKGDGEGEKVKSPLVRLVSKKMQKKAEALAYAGKRATEKKEEGERAVSMKGILKNTRVDLGSEGAKRDGEAEGGG